MIVPRSPSHLLVWEIHKPFQMTIGENDETNWKTGLKVMKSSSDVRSWSFIDLKSASRYRPVGVDQTIYKDAKTRQVACR